MKTYARTKRMISNKYDFTKENIIKCRTCIRKMTYVTREQAERIASYSEKQCDKKLRVYKCPYCDYFHITHKEK